MCHSGVAHGLALEWQMCKTILTVGIISILESRSPKYHLTILTQVNPAGTSVYFLLFHTEAILFLQVKDSYLARLDICVPFLIFLVGVKFLETKDWVFLAFYCSLKCQ